VEAFCGPIPCPDPNSAAGGQHPYGESIRPCWDCVRRLLSYDGCVVKHFRVRAANQEKILTVFQEDNWIARIDDPLSPTQEQDVKRRLNETIRSLNRRHENHLIRFRGDGTGQGVLWEPLSTAGMIQRQAAG
jgi:hypothetical protein